MEAYAQSKTPIDKRDVRATPWELVQALEKALGHTFGIDVCAEPTTAKAATFWTEQDDSLSFSWADRFADMQSDYYLGIGMSSALLFMNPPYSNVTPWLEKAVEAANDGLFVVGVLPDDRGTRWYQAYIEGVATHAWLPTRRISFLDANGRPQTGNPKPTVCPLWTPWRTGQTTYSRLEYP